MQNLLNLAFHFVEMIEKDGSSFAQKYVYL